MLLSVLTITYSILSKLKTRYGRNSVKLTPAAPHSDDVIVEKKMEFVTNDETQGFHQIELNKTIWNIPNYYTDLIPVGAGAFGQVYSANDCKRNQRVAVKKLSRPFQSPEHAKMAYREIKLLGFMNHDNVIDLLNVFSPTNSYDGFQDVYFVSSYIGADLSTHIRAQRLQIDQIQLIVYQILRGLKYVHSAGIIHRDLKPGNIVVSPDAEVKIIDFGLARHGEEEMTGYVTTRYYRAPEIMLNWMHYGDTVDIWSVGCIMAEMLTGGILFKGVCHIDQLKKTLALLGTPGPPVLQKMTSEYGRKYIESQPLVPRRNMAEVFQNVDQSCLDLLEKMLSWDPDERITAVEALAHPFFELFADRDDEPTSASFSDPKDENSNEVETWRRLVYDLIVDFTPSELDALDS